MADELWPDHPLVSGDGSTWPDHPVAQSFYPNTEVRATPVMQAAPGGDLGMPSMAPGILAGAADYPAGAAQLAAHGAAALSPQIGGPAAKAADAAVQYLADPGTNDPGLYGAGRTIGNIAAPLLAAPLMPAAPATALGRIGYGAATGLGIGAATPVENPADNYWGQKASQAGPALAIGGAIPAAGAATRALVPGPSAAIQALRAIGVEPTPGAAAGGPLAVAEDLWGRIPVLGAPVQAGRRAAQEQFNAVAAKSAAEQDAAVAANAENFRRDTINRALAPIGEKLHPETPLNNEAIAEMAEKASKGYQALLPEGGAAFDGMAQVGLDRLRRNAQMLLPPDRAKQFDNFVQQNVIDRLDNWRTTGQPFTNNWMTGRAFKLADKAIGDEAATYSKFGATADEAKLGEAYKQLRSTMRDWAERMNPDAAGVQNANDTWKQMLRIQDAAARSPTGEFTPEHLAAAAKKYGGNVQYARGGALMQDVAQNAVAERNALLASGRQSKDELAGLGKSLRAPAGGTGHGAGITGGIIGAEALQHLMEHPSLTTAITLGTAYPALAALYSNAGRRAVNGLTGSGGGLLSNLPATPLAAQFGARQGLLPSFGQPPNQ